MCSIGVDPAKLPEVYAFDWIDGDDSTLDSLGAGETLVEEQFAKAHDLDVGTAYEAVTPTGGQATLTPIGIYRDPTVLQGSLATVTTLRSISPARDPISLLVATDDDADIATVQSDIKGALAAFPALKVQDGGVPGVRRAHARPDRLPPLRPARPECRHLAVRDREQPLPLGA